MCRMCDGLLGECLTADIIVFSIKISESTSFQLGERFLFYFTFSKKNTTSILGMFLKEMTYFKTHMKSLLFNVNNVHDLFQNSLVSFICYVPDWPLGVAT